jgi:cytochrome c553
MKQFLLSSLSLILIAGSAIAAPPVGDAERGGKIHRGEVEIAGVAACSTCHGVDGNETIGGPFPRLAGQYPEYLLHALKSYANGTRNNAVMLPIAGALSLADMEDLAAFYGEQQGALEILNSDE